MKLSYLIATGICSLAINMPAKASVVWNLNDFFFGSQAVQGFFVWDEDNNSISDWDITTGVFLDSPEYYNQSTGSASTIKSDPNQQTLRFLDGVGSWEFRIGVENLDFLDVGGRKIPLMPNLYVESTGFLECNNCDIARFGSAGAYLSSPVSPVPEPSTVALMLGGLGLVGFMAMRRRKTFLNT